MHGNETIIEQKGPKLVYSIEQRKALELMAIAEEKCPIAQRGDKSLRNEKAYHFSLNYQARRFN